MCSWTCPSTGKFKTQRSELAEEVNSSEDDESEDQVVYRHDLPNELLGIYQQRHQAKSQGSSHGIVNKERKSPQDTSAKIVVPPSAVEEAAWASLTQADKHWRVSSQRPLEQEHNEISHGLLDSTERRQGASPTLDRSATAGIQGGTHGDGSRKISWAEALEQLIRQEVHSDEKRAPVNLQAGQNRDDHGGVDVAQTTFDSVRHGARTAGQLSKFQPEQQLDTIGSSKGKQKHHQAERFRINNLKAPQPHVQEGAPIPLAQRLQELVEGDSQHNAGPRQAGGATHRSSSLTITEKLQTLIQSSASPKIYHQQIVGKLNRQSPSRSRKPVSTVKINRSAIQDDIVDCPDPDEDDSEVQGSSKYLENPVQRSSSARNVQKLHPGYKDEPIEDIDNDEDFVDQETSTAKCLAGAPSIAATSISDRFRDALLAAAPDIDSCGLSARLETLLLAHKSRHMHFTKSLQRKQQGRNFGDCLEVVVLGTIDEAQLTTCRCEVLRSPEKWNHEEWPQKVRTVHAQNASVLNVIFSKTSSGMELHVGRVVRIHPPWYAWHGTSLGRLESSWLTNFSYVEEKYECLEHPWARTVRNNM